MTKKEKEVLGPILDLLIELMDLATNDAHETFKTLFKERYELDFKANLTGDEWVERDNEMFSILDYYFNVVVKKDIKYLIKRINEK